MPEVDPKLLQEAFESFMATSKLMEKAYHELQAKVEQLNLELEEKNKELAAQLEATEHARAQVSDVLASLHLAVVVFDAEGKLARINRAGQELFGVREEAAIGLGLVEVFAIKFNGITGLPTWSDSAGLMAEFEVGSLDDPPGRVLRCSTHRMRGMDGGEGRILLAEDITDAVVKRAAAARHQRLAAMGELAVQIVHQIRNPMGSIELFASMLQRDLATQPEMADVAGKVQQGIRSLNLIVSNLLSFAKGAEPVVQLIDFRHLLESAVAEIDVQLLQNNISMATEIDPEATFISVDPDLWRQVMLNLMINATQAMAGGGELNVQTRRSQNGGGLPVTQVIIGDTGSGIPSGIREQVFNPFFTTKERGAGVGLALVHNIVRAHGGSIEFDSVEGGGTTFTITLPG
ncbi:MAG: ATP-binding protein [Candidatus Lernaella stagnicola]|nr:ATP-binding protein [Candidatus Lernaella stagnicola]